MRYFQRQDLRPNPKRQPVTWRPNSNTRANPFSPLNYGNQVGGGTVHYGAVSWRFHEDDFGARSQTIERYGAAAIPEDCSLTDWPLSCADLEPYYDRAFIARGSTHPSIGGFNPTLTMQALAYMTADAMVERYQKNPGRFSRRRQISSALAQRANMRQFVNRARSPAQASNGPTRIAPVVCTAAGFWTGRYRYDVPIPAPAC